MAAKFLRQCFVTILETPFGERDEVIKQIWGYDQNPEATVPTGLRINFNIDKQFTDAADSAVLKIYNLNRESRQAIAQRWTYPYKTSRVRTLQIQAGYGSEFGALFNGGIERATNTRQGPDWITEIRASSALSQALFNVLDQNWQSDAGTLAKTIADRLFEAGGLGKAKYSDGALQLLQGLKIPSFAASGSVYETLSKMMLGVGLVFTIDVNGALVTEPGNPMNSSEWLVVDEVSGLVGSPRIDNMGYEFRTLIDHRLTMGQLVKVESQTLEESTPGLDALATVWAMNIRGDTHEDDWYMDAQTLFFPLVDTAPFNIGPQPVIQGEIKQ